MKIDRPTSLLCVLLALGGGTPALPFCAGQMGGSAAPEQVVLIPANSLVEVRMRSDEKLQGRLGDVKESAFELRTGSGGKEQTRLLPFTEVRSVRQIGDARKEPGLSRRMKVLAWVSAGVGIFLLVMAVR